MQTFVAAGAIGLVAVVAKFDGTIEKARLAADGLLVVSLAHLLAGFEQRQGLCVAAHQQVAHVAGQSGNEVAAVESLLQYLVE